MTAPGAAVLRARPHAPAREDAAPGVRPLTPEAARSGLLVVPEAYRAGQPAALLVVLHGAGGDARGAVALFAPLARALDAILVVPESRAATWDVIASELGPDVVALDRALERAFDRVAVDPRRVGIAGFSDGASYALTLGLANGDLFRAVLAFSPGFGSAPEPRGRPSVFVSHGTGDRVLPIERTSRRIVPRLSAQGYEVGYAEFEGAHAVPAEIQARAARWLGWRDDP